jgi:hypothetical protein
MTPPARALVQYAAICSASASEKEIQGKKNWATTATGTAAAAVAHSGITRCSLTVAPLHARKIRSRVSSGFFRAYSQALDQ